MTGYIIAGAVLLLVDGLLFNAFALGARRDALRRGAAASSTISCGTTMIASVFISMRLLAEERQTGTLALLTRRRCTTGRSCSASSSRRWPSWRSSPSRRVYMPALILVNGKVSFGHLAAGYLGAAAARQRALAIGTFGSALARTQVLAAIISGVIIVVAADLRTCWRG